MLGAGSRELESLRERRVEWGSIRVGGGRLFSTKIIRYTNNDRIRRITFSQHIYIPMK